MLPRLESGWLWKKCYQISNVISLVSVSAVVSKTDFQKSNWTSSKKKSTIPPELKSWDTRKAAYQAAAGIHYQLLPY